MQQEPAAQKGPEKSAKRAAGGLISSLIKAKRDLQLYPAGNAAVTESLQKLVETFQKEYKDEEVIELLVQKDRLSINGVEVDTKDGRTKDLTLSLFRRGVKKLLIDPSIPLEEIEILLGVLNLPKEKIAVAGGIEKISKSRNIIHAVFEETADLTVLDGDGFSIPGDIVGELVGEETEPQQAGSSETFGGLFVRVQAGNQDSIRRLQSLLKKPTNFSRVLEKFALQMQKVDEQFDPVSRVERMLNVLRTINTAAGQLPSQEERSELIQNLAMSVLNMSANIKTELVSEGLVPNLALKSIESDILSMFPVTELADVLLENLEMSGATTSVVQSYFNDLNLPESGKLTLADTLKERLNNSGLLTDELDELLNSRSADSNVLLAERDIVYPEGATSKMAGYPADKVLFIKDERAQLREIVAEEFRVPLPEVMMPALLELMRYETNPAHHALLIAKARLHMEFFLKNKDFQKAAAFLNALREEYKQKEATFSADELQPLRMILNEYCSESRVYELVSILRTAHAESADFERLVQYFNTIGAPAISSLMHSLEDEHSRHARLLICKALAQSGEKNIVAIAETLKHQKWYVVRNTISILGQTGSPACVPYLRPLLKHQDIRVRKEVLRALAAIRSGEAVELLCLAIQDEDEGISKAAVGWAAAIEAEEALPVLQKMFDGPDVLKRDDELLRLAIEALKAIGTGPAIHLLEGIAQIHSLLRRKKAACLRDQANTALEELSQGKS
jgi:hypothetical protein